MLAQVLVREDLLSLDLAHTWRILYPSIALTKTATSAKPIMDRIRNVHKIRLCVLLLYLLPYRQISRFRDQSHLAIIGEKLL